MPREEPFFRKCCFCIPLQSCLQLWSCIKSIADLSIAVFLALLIILLGPYELRSRSFSLSHMFIILIVLLVIDSVFMLVLTIGLCTKNLRTLRVFLYYSIYMVVMGSACFFGFLIYGLEIVFNSNGDTLIILPTIFGIINTALDITMIFTLKSEMIKLRNKQQYGFVQMQSLDTEEAEPTEPFQSDLENVNL